MKLHIKNRRNKQPRATIRGLAVSNHEKCKTDVRLTYRRKTNGILRMELLTGL